MNTIAKPFFKYTWQDPKFTKLTPEEKLMYKYIWESSDIAGLHSSAWFAMSYDLFIVSIMIINYVFSYGM